MDDTLLLAQLRAQFADSSAFDWPGELPLDATRHTAAVLIPIIPEATGLQVLLTRRTEHLHHHPGQISFPGGRIDAGDANAEAAALRECEEEIGLLASDVELLGQLPDYATSSGFRVTPFVGLVSPRFEPRLDSFEVAELFAVPLRFVLSPSNFQQHRVRYVSGMRQFYAVPHHGRFIWGVTAGMLAMLAAFVGENGR